MQNRFEFIPLFREFIKSFAYTAQGLRCIAFYDDQRQQWCRKFEAITATLEANEDLVEPIVYQLFEQEIFALNNRDNNSANLSYIQINHLGKAILKFISRCNNHPQQLLEACCDFYTQNYCPAFPMELLTPILNALQPNYFISINSKTLQVINDFADTAYSQKLIHYPVVNIIGHNLIQQLIQEMHKPGVPALHDNDLFDMFCHWLVTIKQYNLAEPEILPIGDELSFTSATESIQDYTATQWTQETGLYPEILNKWAKVIERKKQVIFYGSPGTGKTFISEKVAHYIISSGDGFMEVVQFHPAYSYEDFIQGIRPQTEDGVLTYPLVPGRFLEFCQKAEACQGLCVLIIDEINRANLAQVFGELMYLLEYRDKKIRLAGNREQFSIPKNVRIIGTMNTADRSIALVDHALRRRFAFIELRPNYQVLRRYHEKHKTDFPIEKLIQELARLNRAIADKHYELGISFFLTENLDKHIADIWQMEIEPYLEEYFFDQPDKVEEFRWQRIESKIMS
ncbi:McrB family protein [Coleofasciculus sp. F4-SAH-05]|uniref:McrB family protein n=1 Tax=Coleofasciculus sp. F4-SAH-05 TaxID=3069525 RepID=UPI0032F8BF6B